MDNQKITYDPLCLTYRCSTKHAYGFHPETTAGRTLPCPSCGIVSAKSHPLQDAVNNYEKGN